MINWDKVPPERREEVEALDARIKDLETGYVHDYVNTVNNLRLIVESVQESGPKESITAAWHDTLDYLAKMYVNLDFTQIPLTEETAPYFVCKRLYEESLLPATERFTKEIQGETDPRTVKAMTQVVQAINQVSKLIPDLSLLIRKIPGCEERRIQRIYVPHKLNTHPDH